MSVPGDPVTAGRSGEGASADDVSVTFVVADPEGTLAGVHLLQEVVTTGQLDFSRAEAGWRLVRDRPPVHRLEYLLELRYADGGTKVVTDPANPRQVAGAFGPKSVVEFPGYAPPAWLSAPGPPQDDTSAELEVPVPDGDAMISVRIWQPAGVGPDTPLPLLVVHDGPEYAALASLTHYLAAGVAGGWLPRLRAALLAPGPRNNWYSANPRYSRALCRVVLPSLADRLPTTVRVGMGTSLGALAMLHAHCRYPESFGALFLQSASFFTQVLDSQERRFPYFRRITRFTAQVHDGTLPGRRIPVALTCGTVEENAANNRRMAGTLAVHGYPTDLSEVADAHNYTAWRDALDPYLTRLLQQVLI